MNNEVRTVFVDNAFLYVVLPPFAIRDFGLYDITVNDELSSIPKKDSQLLYHSQYRIPD